MLREYSPSLLWTIGPKLPTHPCSWGVYWRYTTRALGWHAETVKTSKHWLSPGRMPRGELLGRSRMTRTKGSAIRTERSQAMKTEGFVTKPINRPRIHQGRRLKGEAEDAFGQGLGRPCGPWRPFANNGPVQEDRFRAHEYKRHCIHMLMSLS